ncbi:MAG TPA: ATP-binding protein [Rubrivivax sp.]|nr:ATP-binding protein [Rubrivivax sp.]
MPPRLCAARRRALRAICVSAFALAGLAAAQPAPKRVLIVHSFGRDYAPYDTVIASFRRELAQRSPQPVVFLEAALDAGRPIGPDEERAFAAYLGARFAQPAPDLVVGSAGPAAQFLVRHRESLFAHVPMLLTAIDARIAPYAPLKPGDAMVASRIDLRRAFEALLQARPDTRRIAVVLGATPLERYWRKEVERELAFLAGRVSLVWLDGLSLAETERRVAALPADSAVFYGLMVVDGAGVPHERLEALAGLKRAAKVPIFSLFESELGQGVVGGPYLSQVLAGEEAARLALRILSPPPPAAPEVLVLDMKSVAYDARELRRWRIDASRLPPDSELRFGEATLWTQHRGQIVAAAAVIAAQAGLIAALLVQRGRRQRAEHEARTLGGRLITAYEDEGRRLARELHDDVTQRLAGLSIEAATLQRLDEPAARAAAERSISAELALLSRDVHALSYRLHPSVIDDLGLEEALRAECERAARRGGVAVAFHGDAAGGDLRGDPALCLFRVAQEALRNAVRHAQAQRIEVRLRRERGGTELSVADDGSGFEVQGERERASLGLASMRERVALLGGRLRIRSRRGQGTRVAAWVPQAAARPDGAA